LRFDAPLYYRRPFFPKIKTVRVWHQNLRWLHSPLMKSIVALTTLLASFSLCACVTKPPLSTVRTVDLERYAGRWYEIARYPNWFQRRCQSGAVAEYTPQGDGSIKVVNSCRDADGSIRSITGRATVVPHSGNARLKVRFFGPFSGDYWIIGIDEKSYSWALVGHPSRRFLWILSREPIMNDELYGKIIGIAVSKGYSAKPVERVSQANLRPPDSSASFAVARLRP
jgi:apolipoprotein D and lipocalin family protein